MRAILEIVIVLIFILGGGPIPAMSAISFQTAGAVGTLFAEVAENAGRKPVRGPASVGASWGQRMWLAVIPEGAAHRNTLAPVAGMDEPRLGQGGQHMAHRVPVHTIRDQRGLGRYFGDRAIVALGDFVEQRAVQFLPDHCARHGPLVISLDSTLNQHLGNERRR